jgi:hypothetical protein
VEFDEIVIGSGLVALAAVLGIDARCRVLVVGGRDRGQSVYYDASRTAPCAHLGLGGLGNYWHGVIPTGARPNFADVAVEDFAGLFRYFYPHTDVYPRLGAPWLFVPWRPVRPQRHWPRLQLARAGRLSMVAETVLGFEVGDAGITVRTDAAVHRGKRLWICAGALHTPQLLERSFGVHLARSTVSDHVICYLGQIDRRSHTGTSAPAVERTRDGVWFEASYNDAGTALLTRKPARFAFARLDHGIEQRAVFGLPTGGAIAKIVRGGSPGLVAEALYNRAGLFAGAAVQSVYAQIVVPDAYRVSGPQALLQVRSEVIRAATDRVRTELKWPQLIESQRPELFVPGIHLHDSVHVNALSALGVNTPAARVHVLDGSVRSAIGPEHHTFKLMSAAAARTRSLSAAC